MSTNLGRVVMRFLFLAFGVLALSWQAAVAAEPGAQPKVRVLLTYGGHGFQEKPFFAMFDALPGIEYTKESFPKVAERLKPGLEKEFDVIVRYDMEKEASPEEQKAFVALLNRGIGLVSLHHNLCSHQEWPEYRKIIGGRYLFSPLEEGGKRYGPSSYDESGEAVNLTIADRDHPITRGLQDFVIRDETYNHYFVEPGVHVLLTTNSPKNNPQVAWTNEYGKSRVFYLQFGHGPGAWKNPVYTQILTRGIRWAAGKE
jgi:type 1 glutamine amidotransferase